jgi:heme/copper-type cytochrome/quinol oxidase subunit 3
MSLSPSSVALMVFGLLMSDQRLCTSRYFTIIAHQEVASGPFCLLVNSPWPLAFALCLFFLSLSGFNLYCWKGIHFSWSLDLLVLCLFFGLLTNFWYRDLLREFYKKYEILLMVLFLLFFLFLASEALLFVSFFWASFHSLSSPTFGGFWTGFYVPDPCELTFANTLLLSNAAVSLGSAFISLEISSSFLIFFSLFSFMLGWTFISLQIKEFRIMGLSINDSVYSSLFFFLTGLHFFHLLLGLLLLSLLFWSCSFHYLLTVDLL